MLGNPLTPQLTPANDGVRLTDLKQREGYGETRKRLDSEGPAPFHQLFQEFASAIVANESSDAIDNANIKGIATKEEVTISLKKTPIEKDTRVSEENVIETRSNSPASETIVCAVEEIYQT